MAKSRAISGVSEPTREAVTAAASEAGMPLGQWAEQALKKALAEGLEAGVSIEEIEARLRRVVAAPSLAGDERQVSRRTCPPRPVPKPGRESVALPRSAPVVAEGECGPSWAFADHEPSLRPTSTAAPLSKVDSPCTPARLDRLSVGH